VLTDGVFVELLRKTSPEQLQIPGSGLVGTFLSGSAFEFRRKVLPGCASAFRNLAIGIAQVSNATSMRVVSSAIFCSFCLCVSPS
jgi:hypothetical protein